jgi:hypothetical protein
MQIAYARDIAAVFLTQPNLNESLLTRSQPLCGEFGSDHRGHHASRQRA